MEKSSLKSRKNSKRNASKKNSKKTKKVSEKINKNNKNNEKLVITAALPYANGPIHIGHLLEYIQADIYSRFLKLQGKDALYICASDMHGTPIEVNAKKAGIPPEQFVEKFWKEHQRDFSSFHIQFDNYYKTHSPENRELSEWFFQQLKKKGHIYTKEIQQMYDETAQQFLPDRFIKGTCPKCGAEDQYGDICEKCNSTYNPEDLRNPISVLSGKKPVLKSTTHYFFRLSAFSKELQRWFQINQSLQPEMKHFLDQWLKEGLQDWCISRDAPYFGFEILEAKKETGAKKYFYVWLDAPIGYISSTKNYCENQRRDPGAKKTGKTKKCSWEDYWYKGTVHHFIGKDIIYFHYLFWPAMLLGVGLPLPNITTHGFITVDGQKMSKSRGTFFTAKDFLQHYPAEALRFYYASHLDRKVEDVDLNFADFQAVNNNVLVGSLGNFCYRVLTFAQKNYGQVKKAASEKILEKQFHSLLKEIEKDYTAQNFKFVVKNILKIADLGNSYFQQAEPWKDPKPAEAVVGWCVNLARNLAILSQPILPDFSQKILAAMQEKHLSWKDLSFTWKGSLQPVEKLVEKIEKLAQPQTASRQQENKSGKKKEVSSLKEKIKNNEQPLNKEDFPLQLRVGKILVVKDHPNTDKLYLLQVDFLTEKRQVVAALNKYFTIKELLNKKTVFCVNLKKAQLRGEWSEAMVLVADDGKKVSLLEPKGAVGDFVAFSGMKSSPKEVSFEEFKKMEIRIQKGKVLYQGKELLGVTVSAVDGAKIA